MYLILYSRTMDKTIIKLLVATLIILSLWGVAMYSRVANIDNNVNKYCLINNNEQTR